MSPCGVGRDRSRAPGLPRVLGGMSPIDPSFLRTLESHGALAAVAAVAIHGFPLDWNHWQIHEWPCKLSAIRDFSRYTPAVGLCQWFHFEDHRLDDAVRWMRDLGVTYLRTGLSWADSLRPDAQAWFDRQMRALDAFSVTLTFCFTPESEGIRPHHTSPPRDVSRFADFCAEQVRRYG